MPITKYIKGNLLDHDGPIAHGVNCQGKMNSGVAKAIREKYPEHFDAYISLFDEDSYKGSPKLGHYVSAPKHCLDKPSKDKCAVWALFTQEYYGYNEKRYVNYCAVARCFYFLEYYYRLYPLKHILGIPKIGAGLGGGDWNIIEQIINDAAPSLDIWVYVL